MKRYCTVDELSRDYRAIAKALPPSILAVAKALSLGQEVNASSDDFVSIRGEGADKPIKAPKRSPKTSNKHIKDLNKKLVELNKQKMALDNMIANLVHGFSDASHTTVNNLKSNTMKLAKAVGKEIDTTKKQLHEASQEHVPEEFKKLFDSSYRAITKDMKGEYEKASKIYLTSEDGDIGAFIVMYNVEHEDKTVSPQEVLAFTYSDGDTYFNPSLTSPDTPGNYNKGMKLRTSNQLNEVKKLFNAQRVADGQLSSVSKVDSPIEDIDLKDKIDGVTKTYVKDGDIVVNFSSEVGNDPKELQSAINDVQVYITHMAYSLKSKVKVVYSKPKKISRGTQVKFSFIPANNYSGMTVNNQETDYLRAVFPESEVSQIKKLLQTMRSNPDTVVEKDYSAKPVAAPSVDDIKSEIEVTGKSQYGISIKTDRILPETVFKSLLARVLREINTDSKIKSELGKFERKIEGNQHGLAPYVLNKPASGNVTLAIRVIDSAKNTAMVYAKAGKSGISMQLPATKTSKAKNLNMPLDLYKLVSDKLSKIKG